MTHFEPTMQAAHARLESVDPNAYARTRNALDGAVTRLSPYLTHGLLSLREVYEAVHARHPLDAQHKFIFELGWRAYWRHVWEYMDDGIHQSLHPGLLPDDAYSPDIPTDVLEARTGIPAIDLAVRELYETGYVHNHARMWLASYLVHLRKVHWHAGAKWMLGHLLDGDIASNCLSWQWVAGTGSNKPYLFNADNVAKYAPAQWRSPGTVIDASYEAMDAMARSPAAPGGHQPSNSDAGVSQPACTTAPADIRWMAPDSALVRGQDVWLVHPWSLGALHAGRMEATQTIAIGLDACHAGMPWSSLRWRFITGGLAARTPHLWWSNTQQLAAALSTARSVRWQSDPHTDGPMHAVQNLLRTVAAPPHTESLTAAPLFEPVSPLCDSFAQWWRKTRLAP